MLTLEPGRWLAAGGLLAGYAGLCWHCLRAARGRVRSARQTTVGTVLLAYASQSGQAHELARQAAADLSEAGLPTICLPLARIDLALLQASRQALFVVSTYGEGDAPDNAAVFEDRYLNSPADLSALDYGLLALGDSYYAQFCAFGRRLDAWLQRSGARPVFERIEVDRMAPVALARWQHCLASFGGLSAAKTSAALDAPLQHWCLCSSRLLNAGSAGWPVYQVELQAVDGDGAPRPLPEWEPGDLLDLFPPGEGARPRTYTIASLPASGVVQLLVREVRGDDGRPGCMSALLGSAAQIGMRFAGRLRANPGFRLGENAARPLILIGNGTGLAGLLAHLRWRAQRGKRRNWLIFGERQAAFDRLCGEELDDLAARGLLAHCDRVFSRDPPAGEYVQHRLERVADTVREWVADGAAIYVCGNAVGMAPAVHETLERLLGADGLSHLVTEGRYRRDVY
ncbi:sulfite reductase subunit alpha [Pseudothauera hydrothermalis]|uniref:sulfite reductase subunit alpha n=1 Tax=Pseudothauera hydrothermalis TaxID=2184083 RepID=UPI000E09352D|nr:sulfite reductase subunit alpha [Pseudothauera hydrothermalis]